MIDYSEKDADEDHHQKQQTSKLCLIGLLSVGVEFHGSAEEVNLRNPLFLSHFMEEFSQPIEHTTFSSTLHNSIFLNIDPVVSSRKNLVPLTSRLTHFSNMRRKKVQFLCKPSNTLDEYNKEDLS